MSQPHSLARIPAVLAACIAVMLAATSARASVITTSLTLPVIGSTYTSSNGAGCFPAVPPAGVCIAPGLFTLTSLASPSTFDADGQNIFANVSYTGMLTTLGNVPIAPISLSGLMVQEVHGRLDPADTGTWATDLVTLSLTGSVLGFPLTLMLDPAHLSTGFTSIVPAEIPGRTDLFRIDSFFDIFVALELNTGGPQPLRTTRGPIHASIVPEPSSLVLLAGGLVAFASRRRRHKNEG